MKTSNELRELFENGKLSNSDIKDMLYVVERYERDAKAREKGIEEVNRMLPLFLWNTDWEKPSPDDIDKLKGHISDMLEGNEDYCGLDDDEFNLLEKFNKKKNINTKDIEKVLDLCKANPLPHEVYSVSHQHVISAELAGGGPSFHVEFDLDEDGEMWRARGVYANWGEHFDYPLNNEEAEALWEKFSYLGDEIAAQKENGSGPRY